MGPDFGHFHMDLHAIFFIGIENSITFSHALQLFYSLLNQMFLPLLI